MIDSSRHRRAVHADGDGADLREDGAGHVHGRHQDRPASTTVSPIAASITAILYNASGTCATQGGSTCLGTFNLTSAATTIAPATNTNGKSVKLTASATSTTPSGSAFLNWASTTGGAFTVVPGEPLAICVPGTNGNQTDTFQPVYVTTSTSVVSSANPSVFGQSVTFTATVTLADRRDYRPARAAA